MADLRTLKTEKALTSALVNLLQTEPFEAINVRQLCEQAMIGRSTFYNHYVDKVDLLQQIVERYARQFEQVLTRRMMAPQMDDLLIDLYKDLVADRETILTLFQVPQPRADLKTRYQASLVTHLKGYLQQHPAILAKTTVPISFLTQLYATNALLAIQWSLDKGLAEEVPRLMNQLMQTTIHLIQSD